MLQKLVRRLMGSSSKVVPAEAKEEQSKSDHSEAALESPSRPDKSFWNDSDYSANSSYRSSSAGDLSYPISYRADMPVTNAGARHKAVPNPLLLAFPSRSDQQGPERDLGGNEIEALADDKVSSGLEHSVTGKKGI